MQMLIPASFFTLAKIGQESDWFQNRNKEIRDELQEHVKDRFTIDDLTQYSPIVATYALNLCGISLWIGVAGYAVAAGTGFSENVQQSPLAH